MKATKNFQSLNVLLPEKMKREKATIVEDFKDVLLNAKAQKRLTCGIYESGKQLESNPDDLMLCVLPSYSGAEATLHIHLTLIEAFCLEVGIQVVKVDSAESVRNLLTSEFGRGPVGRGRDGEIENDEDEEEAVDDFNCLLVEFPDGKLSPLEEKLMDYCTYHNDDDLPAFQLLE